MTGKSPVERSQIFIDLGIPERGGLRNVSQSELTRFKKGLNLRRQVLKDITAQAGGLIQDWINRNKPDFNPTRESYPYFDSHPELDLRKSIQVPIEHKKSAHEYVKAEELKRLAAVGKVINTSEEEIRQINSGLGRIDRSLRREKRQVLIREQDIAKGEILEMAQKDPLFAQVIIELERQKIDEQVKTPVLLQPEKINIIVTSNSEVVGPQRSQEDEEKLRKGLEFFVKFLNERKIASISHLSPNETKTIADDIISMLPVFKGESKIAGRPYGYMQALRALRGKSNRMSKEENREKHKELWEEMEIYAKRFGHGDNAILVFRKRINELFHSALRASKEQNNSEIKYPDGFNPHQQIEDSFNQVLNSSLTKQANFRFPIDSKLISNRFGVQEKMIERFVKQNFVHSDGKVARNSPSKSRIRNFSLEEMILILVLKKYDQNSPIKDGIENPSLADHVKGLKAIIDEKINNLKERAIISQDGKQFFNHSIGFQG